MKSFFFHLSFELFKTAPERAAAEDYGVVFIPPRGTDIFASDSSALPLHSTYPWGDSFGQQDEHILRKRAKSDSANGPRHQQRLKLEARPKTQRSQSSSSPLLNRSVKTKGVAVDEKRAFAEKDYRFDRVSVVSIDMVDSSRPGTGARGKSTIGAEKQKATEAVISAQPPKASYTPLDPKNTELGWGVVHLYREVDETPSLLDSAVASSSDGANARPANAHSEHADGSMLCILAVPSYMSPSDLLGYVGEGTSIKDVSHFRMVRTGRANKYMVLMKFRNAERAKEWQKEYNGKPFNSMEVCSTSQTNRDADNV
jgi:BRCA1-associated protein